MVDIFDTHVLNRVVDERLDDTQFLVNTFFPSIETSEEETIMFDRTEERNLVTPFVSPLHQGRIVAEKGYETDSFRPAYAKDLRHFDPNKAFRRLAGEKIGGTLSPGQRHQAKIAFALDEQIKMLNRRFEVMAADVLVNGTETITGEGIPTRVVDFKRKTALRKALLTTSRWGETGVSPVDNVDAWAQEVADASGIAPTDVVMTVDAWNLYKVDPKLDKLLDKTRNEMADAMIATGPMLQPRAGVVYRGRVGYLRFWTYTGTYTDPVDNVVKPMLPPYTVLIAGKGGVDGVRHFGAIRDEDAGIQARQYFVKSWTQPNPSARFMLMQSAPLLVPYRINNTLSATVR